MPEYDVTWQMTVWADDAHMAAEIARKHQRDPTAMVGVFDVTIPDGTTLRIDLDDDEGEHPTPARLGPHLGDSP